MISLIVNASIFLTVFSALSMENDTIKMSQRDKKELSALEQEHNSQEPMGFYETSMIQSYLKGTCYSQNNMVVFPLYKGEQIAGLEALAEVKSVQKFFAEFIDDIDNGQTLKVLERTMPNAGKKYREFASRLASNVFNFKRRTKKLPFTYLTIQKIKKHIWFDMSPDQFIQFLQESKQEK